MTSKRQLTEEFSQLPDIKSWLDSSNLKPATGLYYSQRLFEFLDSEPPKEFLNRALKNPREISIEVKKKIGAVAQRSPALAHQMRASLKSFLEFYETEVHMNGKLKVRRKWNKPFLSWADAEKIIAKCKQPYESIFRFMLWSGLGQDEVMEINANPGMWKRIEEQRADPKRDYIVIDLEPRKQTLTRYFTAAPKDMVPIFPLKTLDYKVRGNKPVHVQCMEDRFRKAAKEVGLYSKGMGPHTLRSVFTSQCAMVGVKESVAEFVKGHGSGDAYGYRREVLNEKYLIDELRKLQAPSVKELEVELREQVAKQELKIEMMHRTIQQLLADQGTLTKGARKHPVNP